MNLLTLATCLPKPLDITSLYNLDTSSLELVIRIAREVKINKQISSSLKLKPLLFKIPVTGPIRDPIPVPNWNINLVPIPSSLSTLWKVLLSSVPLVSSLNIFSYI